MAGSWDKFWSGIDAKNLSTKHRNMLMNDVYGGYKTRTVSVRGRRGKYGYGKSSTKEVPFYDYYNGGGWDAIKGAVGIKNVNSTDEIRRLYDYVSGYKPPAPAKAKAAPAPYAATTNPSNTTAAGQQYQSQIANLVASLKVQQQQKTAPQAASASSAQTNYQSQLSKMQSLYASNLQSTKNEFGLQIKGLQQNIADQAAGFKQSIADQAAQFKAEQQTMMTNQERARLAGATPQLRLQEAQDMEQAGTKTFKKRIGSQFNPAAYGSLAAIKSGTLNI